MKSLKISIVLSFITTMLAPALFAAGSNAQVVAEDPDGGLVVRGGSTMAISSGDSLQEGDVIMSNRATVIVSVCDGSLVTIYPNSEVAVSSLTSDVAVLSLNKGEILGDTMSGCSISVANKAGSADISNGVYGVLINQTGDGWTLQVRNLDGNVTFTGGDSLDTSNVTASIVTAGESTSIPAGEEMILRGTYNPSTDVFTLVTGGAAIALLPDETAGAMQAAAARMARLAGEDEEEEGEGLQPEILVPDEDDIETASEI